MHCVTRSSGAARCSTQRIRDFVVPVRAVIATRHYRKHSLKVAAASSVSSETVPDSPAALDAAIVPSTAPSPLFHCSCPICTTTDFAFADMTSSSSKLFCPICGRSFDADEKYVDLTIASGFKPRSYQQKMWNGTELFRNPNVSFVYERGWRQGFAWAGFPGVEREYDMAMEYLRPAQGELLVDMSCGSGLFTRRFARSGKFKGVIAADYSESMLRQTREYFKAEATNSPSCPVLLLRADVGRLPFASGSVAAIHAGAAIHCWPSPQLALAEISRVLRPGGVFVASTFLDAAAPLGQILGNDELVKPLGQIGNLPGTYKWWEEAELQDLCSSVGLQGYERQRSWRFIMFRAQKPAIAA